MNELRLPPIVGCMVVVDMEPVGLAVDWVYGHLYWTDTVYRAVMMSNLDGTGRVTIVTKNLLIPRGIAVDPKRRFVFLSTIHFFCFSQRVMFVSNFNKVCEFIALASASSLVKVLVHFCLIGMMKTSIQSSRKLVFLCYARKCVNEQNTLNMHCPKLGFTVRRMNLCFYINHVMYDDYKFRTKNYSNEYSFLKTFGNTMCLFKHKKLRNLYYNLRS